jgi:hypothetical protein
MYANCTRNRMAIRAQYRTRVDGPLHMWILPLSGEAEHCMFALNSLMTEYLRGVLCLPLFSGCPNVLAVA